MDLPVTNHMIQRIVMDLDPAADLIVTAYLKEFEGEWIESDFEDIGAFIEYRMRTFFEPEPDDHNDGWSD